VRTIPIDQAPDAGDEEYYDVDSIHELDLWEREFNIPPTEVAPIVFDHKGSRHLVQGVWSLVPPDTPMLEEIRRISTSTPRQRHWRSSRFSRSHS